MFNTICAYTCVSVHFDEVFEPLRVLEGEKATTCLTSLIGADCPDSICLGIYMEDRLRRLPCVLETLPT